MRKIIAYIAVAFILNSCTKEFEADDFSAIDIEVVKDNFSDSLYRINNINVTTSNDELLDNGYAKILDESENILIEGAWRTLINQTISLTESKKYNLTITLSPDKDENAAVENQFIIDNINYPKFIQIESIVMSQNVLEDSPYGESVSNSHITLVRIRNAFDAYFDDEEHVDDETLLYLHKTFSPKTTNFNFSNTQIPVRTHTRDGFKNYELYVGYPLVVGTTITDDRKIYFSIDIEQMYIENEGESNTLFTYVSEDSDYGGIYSGTLKYKWIYD